MAMRGLGCRQSQAPQRRLLRSCIYLGKRATVAMPRDAQSEVAAPTPATATSCHLGIRRSVAATAVHAAAPKRLTTGRCCHTSSSAVGTCVESLAGTDAAQHEGDSYSPDNGDDDDELAAYEELLLNADAGSPDDGGKDDGTGGLNDGAASDFLADVLALLPQDGRPLRLTALTPSLDVEAISEMYGSVLQMLQRHPKLFVCSQMRGDASGAAGASAQPPPWFVRRRDPAVLGAAPSPSAAAPSEARLLTAGDMADLLLEDELGSLGLRAAAATLPATPAASRRVDRRPCPARRLGPVTGLSDTAASGCSDDPLDWTALAAALPRDGPVTLPEVRRSLTPNAVQSAISRSGKGLLRLYHEQYPQASAQVEVSLDGLYMARRGCLGRHAAWTPQAAAAAAAAVKFSETNEGDWTGELDLDGDPAASGGAVVGEGEESLEDVTSASLDALALATEPVGVFYKGLEGPAAIRFFKPRSSAEDGIRRAKQQPSPRRSAARNVPQPRTQPVSGTTPPPLQQQQQQQRPQRQSAESATASSSPKAKPRTPEELLAMHTELAVLRGWRSPAEMLDLLVECIPTFFVPTAALVMSDSLAKVLGPRNTIQQVVRVYSYYCERDRATDRVRLRPGLSHPHLGKANVHYEAHHSSGGFTPAVGPATHDHTTSAGTGAHLQRSATTRAFPVLPAVIKSSVDVGTGGMRKSARQPQEAPRRDSSSAALPSRTSPSASGNPFSLLRADARADGTRPPASVSAVAFFYLAATLSFTDSADVATVAIRLSEHLGPLVAATAAEDALRSIAGATSQGAPAVPVPLLQEFCAWVRQFQLLLFTTEHNAGADGGQRDGIAAPSLRVRLRPLWIAPGAAGELGAEALPAACAKQLRPLWRPVTALLNLAAVRDELLASAPLANEDAAKSLAAYLRRCGRYAWVDESGTRVRRFTGVADMDDLTHAAVDLLASSASATNYEPAAVVVERAGRQLQAVAGVSSLSDTRHGLAAMLSTNLALTQSTAKQHPKDFDCRLVDGEVHIRRKTCYAAFGNARM